MNSDVEYIDPDTGKTLVDRRLALPTYTADGEPRWIYKRWLAEKLEDDD
jgi:hypothetical protein